MPKAEIRLIPLFAALNCTVGKEKERKGRGG